MKGNIKGTNSSEIDVCVFYICVGIVLWISF